ncbi:hypothetical protein LTS02_007185 [Friedmanniomyces endolithicus]|nr:hypothetical protein LTS02_007185 [Friedmanniomyces endolithicus]KAK1088770.1 hypothetical protein LTR33_000385 [Friedmanniomyces endolithicus]
MSTNTGHDDSGSSPKSPRAALVNGEQSTLRDGDDEGNRDAAGAVGQNTAQASSILSAEELAELERFFEAPDDFMASATTTSADTLQLTAAEINVVRKFFDRTEVVRARARAERR